MKLFFSPGACSLAPHIVLREAGLPFTLEKVDTARHLTAHGADYYAVNPKGQVPLLELEDGQRLSEGPVIAQYIADRAQQRTLMPEPGSLARYRVMEWQNYITSELHKSFTPLFNGALDGAAKSLLRALLRKKFEWVDSRLSDSDFLTGESFTAADAYLFTVAGWSRFVALDLSDLRHLQRFLAQVGERPAVREAMRAEGLLPA
ncbi:glutathione S-transferase [Burkholderiaceae bacterium]|nr:glutathione S-transferase [Burkholderiaceae bacterium]